MLLGVAVSVCAPRARSADWLHLDNGHVRLGVDPKQADQQVRGTVGLPHGLGKSKKVAVVGYGSQGHAQAQNLRDRFQFISRLDYYDPDRDIEDDQITTYGVGLVYFWDGNSKVKLVYEIPKAGVNSRSGVVTVNGVKEDEKDNILTLEWVYAF